MRARRAAQAVELAHALERLDDESESLGVGQLGRFAEEALEGTFEVGLSHCRASLLTPQPQAPVAL